MDLDLRRVRYFVEVAEQLSFVRAAEALHLTQPALSRQIAALEDEWGVRLFARSRRGTELTPEGTALVERARTMLRHAADFERHARVIGREPARFVIGFMPGVDAAALIDGLRRREPELDVTAIFTSVTAQDRFLRDGRADVVFVRPPIRVDGVRVIPLFEEPLVAAVRRDDPLVRRGPLRLAELAQTRLPLLQRRTDARAGLAGTERFEPEQALLSVAAGSALALLPAGIAGYYTDPAIAYVPLLDAPPQQIALAYDERRTMPAIEQFVALCRDELAIPVQQLPIQLAAASARPGDAP